MVVRTRGAARDIVWSPTGSDLVRIATAVVVADRLFTRPRWGPGRRVIEVAADVSSPTLWQRARRTLQGVLEVLSGDSFQFEFSSLRSRVPHRGLPTSRYSADQVALFSGGLDSGCAAAHFARIRAKTCYVTQYVNGIASIEQLLLDIYQAFGTDNPPLHAAFQVFPTSRVRGSLREHTRRTRSFLFCSLGLACAEALGARQMLVCENGPVALNLPLLRGMQATRHAHSQFLDELADLSRRLLGSTVAVKNPFELTTKGAMTAIFAGKGKLALSTLSCWNQQWSGLGRRYSRSHCGTCLPCLVRRASLVAAGISIPRNHFDCDVGCLGRNRAWQSERLNRLRYALAEFVTRVERCQSWQELLREFPDVIDSSSTMEGLPPRVWYERVFAMMRAYCAELRAGLNLE